MAKFKITDSQTGKTVIVSGDTAPNEQEAEQIFSDAGLRAVPAQTAPNQAQPSLADQAIDAARAIPGGLAKGVTSLAGLPGDLSQLGSSMFAYGLGKLGADPASVAKYQQDAEKRRSFPTHGELDNKVTAPFGGYYEPKTTAGEYAQTIASFAPSAIAPGGAIARTARVVVPAVASEAAGQATKGTTYEPYARAAGALGGGLAVGGIEGALRSRSAPKVPTSPELSAAAQKAYSDAENAGVVIRGDKFQEMAQSAASELADQGLDPTLHPKATAVLNRLTNTEGDVTLKKAETLRKVVNNALTSNDKSERRLAFILRDKLDDFVENLSPSDVTSGEDPAAATAALKNARGLWQQSAKADTIDATMVKARNRAENVGGSGLENAVRVEFRKLVQNDKAMRRFSPAEQDAIRQVVRGGVVGNLLRQIGKFAPTGVVPLAGGSSAGAYIGGLIGGPPGAFAGAAGVPIAGSLGRMGATASTLRNVDMASGLMRGAQPIAASPIPRDLLLEALLSQAQGRHVNQTSSGP